MSDKTNIIELLAGNLKNSVPGWLTEKRNRIAIERDVIPIIFIPGIMGSRLKNNEGMMVWDPDSDWFMFSNYGRRKADAKLKKDMVIGEKFNPDYLDVLNNDKVHNKKFADRNDKSRGDRGWGGVSWSTYGKILKELQNRKWDPAVNLFFEFPVHAFGYNWTASNHAAGKMLSDEINRLINDVYKDRNCKKVILVTHSMGGLVARSACMVHDAMDKVLGIVHGVQPWNGAATAYWRMKGGFERPHSVPDIPAWKWVTNPIRKSKHEFTNLLKGEGIEIPVIGQKISFGYVTAWVLGTDGKEVTALLGNMPGGLELLPNKRYKNNNGSKRWLELIDSKGNRKVLPESDPYTEIYQRNDVYYRLINPDWLNPGKTEKPEEKGQQRLKKSTSSWNLFLGYLGQAEDFHESLDKKKLHPETYQFFSSGIATADRVVFSVADDTLWETVKRKIGLAMGMTPGKIKDKVKGDVKDGMLEPVKEEVKTMVFKKLKGMSMPILIDCADALSASIAPVKMGSKARIMKNLRGGWISIMAGILRDVLIEDSDWYKNRGGYREHVDAENKPASEDKVHLVTMQLPDGSGDGTVPDSSGRSGKVARNRTFCIADQREFEGKYVKERTRLKPKQKPEFDEGYFERGHEPIYKTQSARFITFTVIENICRNKIKHTFKQTDV